LMSTPHALTGGGAVDYGFGLFIDSFEGHDRIHHGGDIFGFNALLAQFPDDGLVVAAMSNSLPISSTRVANGLIRTALGLSEAASPVAMALSEEDAARCEGVYAFPDSDWEMTIFRRGGKLFSQSPGDPDGAMTYVGKGEFRTVLYDNDVRLVFDLAGDKPAPAFVLHDGAAVLTAKRK